MVTKYIIFPRRWQPLLFLQFMINNATMRQEIETGRNAEKHMIWNVLIVILVILIIVLAVLYFMGRRLQKKQDESQAQLDAMAQTASMLIIDKKRMKIKESGLPAVVISQTPWYLRRSKVPVVKAKVGPKIMTLIADEKVFEQIPVKKEVKVVISGIYITAIKSARGGLEKPQKKQGFFKRHFGKKS